MEWQSGNIFIRRNILERAGDVIDGHAHRFDHTSYVICGMVRVEAVLLDGRQIEKTFGPGDHFLVLAGVQHKITAVTDGVMFDCIYSHRTPQGEVVQQATGWEPAYG